MSPCPECGLDPTATTQDDNTEASYFECENGHFWPADPADP